jgi:type IV pilus assembly protein PilM
MSLWNSVKSMLGGGESNILGIDMGTSSIKIVELKKASGKVVLQTYGEIALGPYQETEVGQITTLTPDQTAAALRELLEKTHVTTRRAVVSIPSSASLLFVIELPRGSETNLAQIVPTEARKYIPVPLSEITLDWTLVPDVYITPDNASAVSQAPTTLRVLVAATRNEAISAYTNIMAQANITPIAYELEVFALVRACIKRELSPIAIVDVGASKTRVSIVHHGIVFTTQMIGRGSHALTQSIQRSLNISFEKAEHLKRTEGLTGTHAEVRSLVEGYFKQLAPEIFSVFTRYEKEYRHAVEKMIITGGGSLVSGLKEFMSGQITMDVVGSDAFGLLDRPKFLDEVLRSIDGSFALSIGLALREIER